MARPGIMIYFDVCKPLKVLPDAEKGRLFDAILAYGEHGTIPEFDGMLAMAWGFIQPKLDRDSKEYERTVLKRQYATFCRELKRKGAPDVSFDAWMEMSDDERNQMLSHDAIWYPTTTGTPTGTPTGKVTVTAAVAADASTTEPEIAAATAADGNLKVVGGKLGKNVVFLTDGQMEDLLDKMGLDVFDYYVDKLSCFIIKNDAHVKNHYETLLSWWQKDARLREQSG